MPRAKASKKEKVLKITTFFKKLSKSKKIAKNKNAKLLKGPRDAALWSDIWNARCTAIQSGRNPSQAKATIRRKRAFSNSYELRWKQTNLHTFASKDESCLEDDPNDGVNMGQGDIEDSKKSYRYF